MNVQKVKLGFVLVFLFVALPLLSKDIFQFDLRDYDMSWGMTKEKVIKLKRKEIIENGTKIIFKDDKGKKWEGFLEYDDNGKLFKIWFNIIDKAKPKNYAEYKVVKKNFLSRYRACIKRMIQVYGNKYDSDELDDKDLAFENRGFSTFGINYNADWIYQYYTLVNITFDGSDKFGYELVLQFISFQQYFDFIKEHYDKKTP